ncbi:BolA/IbaG family iron-sulfur metabolism protein, partial [Salmonella enterica subsp. enterica serovar Kentucky]|nr:BolA/IbaG family iron-sulfur metabolism protein [Salmonella enterica subsp. enterica serovar Kentucky]
HRMIYGTLTAELSTTVHALALHTYTLKEWEGLQDTIFASPPCINFSVKGEGGEPPSCVLSVNMLGKR